jgi:uncharacterized protein YneF (UPF0154 family)
MKGISIKAVLIATLLTLVVDIVISIVLTFIYGTFSFSPGMTESEMKNAMAATTLSTPFLVCAMILGSLSTALGGFVSAQLSKAAPYLNALAFGAAGIIIGALMAEGLPLWYNILAFGAVIPASLFGAYFFARRQGFNT